MKIFFFLSLLAFAQDYALDDAHNHDGTHVEGQSDCGGNYMFPGDVARLGSHSFLILGEDGPNHLLLDHRSGTPPHTYQFILRVRADENEMATYRKLLKETKISLPAVTTIYFDKAGQQKDRTFFCLHDLKKIFGSEQKADDAFAKLFPIRASWQKDADFEGAFPIKETVVPEDPFVIDRKDVEIVLFRYLPSYLEQAGFRKMLKSKGAGFTSLLSHAPIRHDESEETARKRSSYVQSGAFETNGGTCAADFYLKSVLPPKTKHSFLLLAESGKNSDLAAHLYDQSPQNYQTTVVLDLGEKQMKVFREARLKSKSPLLFVPTAFLCMSEIKDLVKKGNLEFNGPLYANSEFEEFRLGEKVGELNLSAREIKVLVNRTLQSLMNPQSVARDVFGFVDVRRVNADISVEAAYATDRNFVGKIVEGYRADKCYLTTKAAKALSEVQKEVSQRGYSLRVFDCYRPQRAVNQFVAWAEGKNLVPTYIDSKSGHTRGSTVDLTLMKDGKPLEMGTAFDFFGEKAHTASPLVSEEARRNRFILKAAMERQGFANYPKEWWHFVLKNETYKKDYFDFEVQ